MSMEYIRKTYGVPAKRGARVRFTPIKKHIGHEGVIVGSRGPHIRVRMDGEKQICTYHPTWEMEYI